VNETGKRSISIPATAVALSWLSALSAAGRAVRRTLRGPWLWLGILVIIGAIAILSPWIAPHSATLGDLRERLEGPSASHWLGTDHQGRDVLSRLMVGSRATLLVAFLGVAATGVIGTVLGLIAGYYGKVVDSVIMRAVDLSFAVPALVLALALAAIYGPSMTNIVVLVIVVFWGQFARQVRGEVLSVREREYVEASRAIGGGSGHIMLRHIFPNVLDSVVVVASLVLGQLVLVEATLSFLGAGIPISTPSWGRMINDGKSLFDAWWVAVAPGIAIVVVVLSINMLGDWLRDRLDPHLRNRDA
jgi:peptide/nickel transport system permease protein